VLLTSPACRSQAQGRGVVYIYVRGGEASVARKMWLVVVAGASRGVRVLRFSVLTACIGRKVLLCSWRRAQAGLARGVSEPRRRLGAAGV
jgi:hypothetical protein